MKTISYCEKVGHEPIDWRKEILKCQEGNLEEYNALTWLATSWATDPVACLPYNIPRHSRHLNEDGNEMIIDIELGGVPEDEGLIDMSIMFLGYLERKEFEYCLDTLKKITDYAEKIYSN